MNSFRDTKPSGYDGAIDIYISEPTCPNTKGVFDYWKSICGENEIPSRTDFSPRAIKPILPYIFMLNILEDGMDFNIRLFGSKCVEVLGFDITGIKVSELPQAESSGRLKLYREVTKNKKPHFIHGSVGAQGQSFKLVESGYFPFLDSEGNFTIILCVFDFLKEKK